MQLKTKFLQGQQLQLLVWFHYIDDIIFSSGPMVKRVTKNV